MDKKVKKLLRKKTYELIEDIIKDLSKSIIFAILTAVFLFFTSITYEKSNEIKNTNKLIDSLNLGESKEYINSILGIPRFEFIDNNLLNSYYSLEHIIVRCVYNEYDSMVGYFVTDKRGNAKIKFKDPLNEDNVYIFGKDTFNSSIPKYDKLLANMGNGGGALARMYYWEYTYMSGVGDFKGFIVAIMPYGFIENESINFTLYSSLLEYGEEFIDYEKYRKQLHPNTYGIIESSYKEQIYPYIENSEDSFLWIECVNNLRKDSKWQKE